MCRKGVDDSQLLYLETKPRPKVPKSPSKGPRRDDGGAGSASNNGDGGAKPRFRPSTKLRALLKEIDGMVSNDPESKCIVFSQWTTMLDLVEVCGWGVGSDATAYKKE